MAPVKSLGARDVASSNRALSPRTPVACLISERRLTFFPDPRQVKSHPRLGRQARFEQGACTAGDRFDCTPRDTRKVGRVGGMSSDTARGERNRSES